MSVAFQGIGYLRQLIRKIGLLIHTSKLPFFVNVDSWFSVSADSRNSVVKGSKN